MKKIVNAVIAGSLVVVACGLFSLSSVNKVTLSNIEALSTPKDPGDNNKVPVFKYSHAYETDADPVGGYVGNTTCKWNPTPYEQNGYCYNIVMTKEEYYKQYYK